MAPQYTWWLLMLFLYGNVQNCGATLGADCTSANEGTVCTVANAHCDNDVCACEVGFTEESDKCMKALGQNCENADECVSNSECDTTCKCSEGFVDSAGLCSKVIGSDCAEQVSCPADSNTVCVKDKCACEDGHVEKNNVCTRTVSGTECTDGGDECDKIDNSMCDADKCQCSPNFVMNVDTCVPENTAASTGVGAMTLVLSVFTTIQVMLK